MTMPQWKFIEESDPYGLLQAQGAVAVRCDVRICNDDHCPGWTWITQQQYRETLRQEGAFDNPTGAPKVIVTFDEDPLTNTQ